MNNAIFNDTTSDIDVVKITEHDNSGVQAIYTSRITIGYVLSGTKYIYHSDRCTAIPEGGLFILDAGHHYNENTINAMNCFEQITFYLTATTLQRVIFGLNINYGLSFSSSHSCPKCIGQNFATTNASDSIRNFFTGLDLSLRNSGLLHNDVGQRIKLNELIFLILSGDDGCIRRKLLRSADTTSGHFINIVYANLFNDISIESLAELTNRSLTSFKKEFRRIFNMPPHRWIIEQRLMRAKIMLSSTKLTVSEIGIDCGFTNISHFIKLFKQRYNTTPAIFRREHSIIANQEYKIAVNG